MKGNTIKTERLTLRNWEGSDRDDFIRLSEDPEIRAWTGRKVADDELFSYYLGLGTAFAVIYDGKVAGNFSLFSNALTRSVRSVRVFECAFYILSCFHGMGLGSEAFDAVLQYAREELGAEAVICGSFSDNDKALRFIRKNGGTYCFSRQLESGRTEDFYIIV